MTSGELMRKGGHWLGALRSRIQTMFIVGNGETITWGSDENLIPHPSIRQVEELGATAVASYITEQEKINKNRPIRFFCRECGKEMWWHDDLKVSTNVICDLYSRLFCSDCTAKICKGE